ncbi:MoxR family ATPase [Streptomyces telluris]|uniref:MoxR family ATPase n=1 Tax=Streptomyces telluris TaxID=2720021 RepID=A0A9X2LH44_9ACTN|nr:MoxR family ATPase [Streptomyces telluris]MCQ8770936.1 MoxR family ATPase [Streptomyces telluris]NJP79830.1 MoxR family ATPase [Streptomyces telluris]
MYRGTGERLHDTSLAELLPPPPPWRQFTGSPVQPPPTTDDEEAVRRLGAHPPLRTLSAFSRREAEMVNAALLLRRPLLVSGRPGTGKSSLAYRISRELRLGRVLRWHITSRTTLQQGLYEYDAVARVQDTAAVHAAAGGGPGAALGAAPGTTPGTRPPQPAVQAPRPSQPPPATWQPQEPHQPQQLQQSQQDLGDYIQLGPLGTALLPYAAPRVLLVDELDKSDLDFTTDLLDVFEEGSFAIPELLRIRRRHPVVTVWTDDPDGEAAVAAGRVTCRAFPVVVMTTNGEREFPPAFLRRCLVLHVPEPSAKDLMDVLEAHFGGAAAGQWGSALIQRFLDRSRERGGLSIDQLLNSLYLAASQRTTDRTEDLLGLAEALWHRLDGSGPGMGA